MQIPKSIEYEGNTLPVTKIGNSAFHNIYQLKKVIIPNTIIEIGSNSFGDIWNLESIEFEAESQLLVIGDRAFWGAGRVKEIYLPNGLLTIGDEAFAHSQSLQFIEFPESVKYVGYRAIYNYNDMTPIVVVANETQTYQWHNEWNLNNFVVYFGAQIRRVTLDNINYWIMNNEATVLGFDTPSTVGVLNIPKTITLDGITYDVTQIGANAFANSQYITQVIIPNTIRIIGAGAFRDSWDISTIIFEENSQLKRVEKEAFNWIGMMQTITLPANLEYIGERAISGYNLEAIYVDETNMHFKSIDGVLYNFELTRLIAYPRSKQDQTFVIPSLVESIDAYAFNNNRHLRYLSFAEGSNLKQIGEFAFESTSINFITLPDGLEEIEQLAFSWNRSLIAIYIPNSVTIVESNALYGDTSSKNLSTNERDSIIMEYKLEKFYIYCGI